MVTTQINSPYQLYFVFALLCKLAIITCVADPNVDVIYVSPVVVNDECMQYYAKLLALKPAVDSGNVDNQSDLSDRYKIVVPEAIKSFPVSRKLCLFLKLNVSGAQV